MIIEELYQNEMITLESYLKKCGVKDVNDFISAEPHNYIDPPSYYTNMSNGVEIYKKHLQLNDGAYILCDSGDTDGICSTVIMYNYMITQNPNWDIEILLHEGKQRGLQDETLFNKVMSKPKGLLIIPDSGTNDKEQVEQIYANTDMEVIVLDHHDWNTPIEKGCLVSNKNNEDISPYGSGALVTHKFICALDYKFGLGLSGHYIDMVALSLISDSMNMADMQNRLYYHYGIENKYCINNEFLQALFDKFIGDKEYTQTNISFQIVPKINAICRSKDQVLKQRVILSFLGYDNIDEVLDLCEEAHKNQRETVSNIVDKNFDKIKELSENNLIIFSDSHMPQSYSGLISGRIMNLYENKPTIVGKIKDGIFLGSLRSPIPLREQLDSDDLVMWANGHTDSCGVCIEEKNIQPLIDKYNSIELDYSTHIEVLKSYSLKSIPNRLFGLFGAKYDVIWGKGIPKPQFHIKLDFNPQDIKIIGKNNRTLKLSIDNTDILLFNSLREDKTNLLLGYYENDVFVHEPQNKKMSLEIIGTLGVNEYKGNKTNQIIIDKYEVKEYNKRTKESLWG